GTVAVVSHPVAVGLVLAALKGVPLEEAHTLLDRENTAVSVLLWDGESRRGTLKDDTAHLAMEEYQAGETAYVNPGFDPDMVFFHLRFVEYGEMMADSIGSIWDELSDPRSFNRDILLEDAGRMETVVGHVERVPAAFLQYGVTPGWISLLCVAPACRNAGLGTQFLGQAVLHTRAMGGDALYLPLAKGNPHRPFFLGRGFQAVEELEDGRELLARDIRLGTDFCSL
ncbi:MAG: GNAT family N-acetyltransferase, partial [Bacteroides sp.]|nr:GNAT family N-acetyltransferase [Bacteroides sp.]